MEREERREGGSEGKKKRRGKEGRRKLGKEKGSPKKVQSVGTLG